MVNKPFVMKDEPRILVPADREAIYESRVADWNRQNGFEDAVLEGRIGNSRATTGNTGTPNRDDHQDETQDAPPA